MRHKMASDHPQPLVMVGGLAGLKGLNPSLTRVLVVTNGQGKAPPGWKEAPGAVHMGAGRWLVPYVRTALGDDNAASK